MSDESVLNQRPATDEPGMPIPVSAITVKPQITLNETMMSHLRNTSPWLRFMGVLYYIGAVILILTGLIMAAVAPFMDELTEVLGGAGGIIMGIIYAGLGVVMIFPARFLYNFGARLRNFFLSHGEEELELALRNNQAFWKFSGILSIVSLALIPLVIIGVVIFTLIGYY